MSKNPENNNRLDNTVRNPRQFVTEDEMAGDDTRILFYSHDTMGLGHIQRNLKIARALKAAFPRLEISLLTGSTVATAFDLPPGVNFIHLPPVRKIGSEKYDSFYGNISFESVLEKRKSIILDSLRTFNPAIFWVDHAPVGMSAELLPALDWISNDKIPIYTILGLRDIIDSPSTIIPLWLKQGIYRVLRKNYDKILIYGDRRLFDPTVVYEFTEDIKEKSSFTGYIIDSTAYESPGEAHTSSRDRKRVFVTIGGGEWYGREIIGSMIDLVKDCENRPPFDLFIVTGPFLSDDLYGEYSKTTRELDIKLVRFMPDLRPHMAASDLVVATAGYNTVTDILACGRKAILIPRVKFREEQLIRARILKDMGLVEKVGAMTITSDSLNELIWRLLENGESPLESGRNNRMIDLDGTSRVVLTARELFSTFRS